MVEIIVAFITGILGPVIYLLVDKWWQLKKDKKRDKVKENFNDSHVIDNELEEIRDFLQSDRVWIAQFHNDGNFYPTGKSIQKFSIFYESLEPGVSLISTIFSNIPCSLYSKTFNHLLESDIGGVMIPDYDNAEVSGYGWRGSSEYTGNKSSYLIPMFSFEDKFIGVLGVDYVFKKKRLSKEEWDTLKKHSYKISGYLSNYLEK